MILWSFRRCPYAMRARLAIASAGVIVELREIVLRNKPAAFIAASAKATVPVLVLSDQGVLQESRDIMFWALNRNDPENWLAPWRADQAGVDAFFDHIDGPFKTHLDRYKYASRFDADAAIEHRAAGAKTLAVLDGMLAKQTNLSGENLAILDFACLPFIRQFRIADEDWFDAQPWPHLHPWLQAFLASPRFAAVMHKYQPWQDGDEAITFPG